MSYQRGRGRGRGRGLATTVRRRNFVTPAQLRRENHGFAPRGSFDPPRIIATPWNSLVLAGLSSATDAGVTQTTVNTLITLLKSQLGIAPADTTPYLIRFQRLDMWSTTQDTVSGTSSFGMLPSDLLDGGHNQTWLEDRGTTARPAHLHWVWSASQQTRVFDSSVEGNSIVYSTDHAANWTWNVHVHILWRFKGGDPIPTAAETVCLNRLRNVSISLD